jgi:hypothetical protein
MNALSTYTLRDLAALLAMLSAAGPPRPAGHPAKPQSDRGTRR